MKIIFVVVVRHSASVAFINVWPRGGGFRWEKKESQKMEVVPKALYKRPLSLSHSKFEMVFRSHAHSAALFVLLFAAQKVG